MRPIFRADSSFRQSFLAHAAARRDCRFPEGVQDERADKSSTLSPSHAPGPLARPLLIRRRSGLAAASDSWYSGPASEPIAQWRVGDTNCKHFYSFSSSVSPTRPATRGTRALRPSQSLRPERGDTQPWAASGRGRLGDWGSGRSELLKFEQRAAQMGRSPGRATRDTRRRGRAPRQGLPALPPASTRRVRRAARRTRSLTRRTRSLAALAASAASA